MSDDFAPSHLFSCGFDYFPTFRDMVPSGVHSLLLRRELGRPFGLRFRRGMAFRSLGLKNGNTMSLRVGDSALLPLTATTIVSIMVGGTVGARFSLCHSELPVRKV